MLILRLRLRQPQKRGQVLQLPRDLLLLLELQFPRCGHGVDPALADAMVAVRGRDGDAPDRVVGGDPHDRPHPLGVRGRGRVPGRIRVAELADQTTAPVLTTTTAGMFKRSRQ